ncbi:V-type ATP synthase subunit I [Synergistales bacterium]|nr:V-type ATP synthase subunit I [Synergistales bacterium]
MAVVGMNGVSFVGPRNEIEEVALNCLRYENFEPMKPDVMLEHYPLNQRFETFKGNRYDALMEKLDELWKRSGVQAPNPKIVSRLPLLHFEDLAERVGVVTRVMDEWRTNLAELQDEREKCRVRLSFILALSEIGYKFSELSNTPYVAITVGTLTKENWHRLHETSLAAPFLPIQLDPVGYEKDKEIDTDTDMWADNVMVALLYGHSYREDMQKILSSVHMRVVQFDKSEYEKYENVDAAHYQLETVESEIELCLNTPARYVADNRMELEKLYAAVYTKQRVESLWRYHAEMGDVYILSGWMPVDACLWMKKLIVEKMPKTMMITEKDHVLQKEGREIPTLLHNLPFIRRFQEIVRLYSLPSYGELDPTFVVALSFCFFFGFMFGDVGHGIALILGTMLLEKKGLMGSAIASVMKTSGVFAMLFGLLYGSVFGNEELIAPLWLSPMHSVDSILPVSIGVGVAFLSLGICFKIENSARRGEWGEAFFSPEGLIGLVFYWLAVGQTAVLMGSDPADALNQQFFTVVMATLFAIMIFGNGVSKLLFHGEKVDDGGVVHVFSVFHAMLNFLSNTASFVRLAAFALNHAGLCGAVFMLSEMVENVPGGKIYHAIVMVIGQLIVIGLEGMIVFIQTLRLEYYEFFGKFYRGGGREFAPVLWKR